MAPVGKLIALGCTVVSTMTRARSFAAQGAGLMRDPQALGQERLQLGADPTAPMAQI